MLLIIIIAIGVLGYYIGANSKKNDGDIEEQLSQRNREWFGFITSYKSIITSKDEKKLLNRIIGDIKNQGLVDIVEPVYPEVDEAQVAQTINYQETTVENTAPEQYDLIEPIYQPTVAAQSIQPETIESEKLPDFEIDNASLLLYFGAFLFVASVGLFVAFSGIGGVIKALAVFAVSISLYAIGCWLFAKKERFSQVGIAFAGIGLAIIPFVGLAAYKYVFNESNASVVWFGTSLLALGVYFHALWFFRKSFLNYLFIFTLLSLFESGVSISSTPIYYFGWGLALIGIAVTAISIYKNIWPEFKEAANNSGQLFIPLSVCVSLVMVPGQGATQLGISLLLATAFYALQAKMNEGESRYSYILLSNALLISAVGSIAYGVSESLVVTAQTLLAVNVIHSVVIALKGTASTVWNNFAGVAISTGVIAALLAIKEPYLLVASLVVLTIMALIIWIKLQRTESHALAVVVLMIIPFVVGLYVIDPSASSQNVSVMAMTAFVIQAGIYLVYRSRGSAEWVSVASQLLLISAVVVVVPAIGASVGSFLAISVAMAIILVGISRFDHDDNWLIAAGIFAVAPVVKAWSGGGDVLTLCIAVGFVINIAIATVYKLESNKWLATIMWVLAPLAVSSLMPIGNGWDARQYTLAYLGVIVSLMVVRYLTNHKKSAIEIQESSLATAGGYIAACFTAISFSIVSSNAQLVTLTLLSILLSAIIFATAIEKDHRLLYASVVLSISALCASVFVDEQWWTLGVALIVSLTSYLIGHIDHNKTWPMLAGVYIAFPIMKYWLDGADFAIATTIALIVNILVALFYRSEVNRWLGSIIWFIMPFAYGSGWLSDDQWSARAYAIAYLGVMVGFVIARSIARGVILFSAKVPLSSYTKTASVSYVTGYTIAALTAMIAAFAYGNNIVTASVICCIALTVMYLSYIVEKEKSLLLLVPILAQIAVFTGIAPTADSDAKIIVIATVTSTLVASIGYVISLVIKNDDAARNAVELASIACLFIVPMSVLVFGLYWTMPFGLFVSGVVLAHKYRYSNQQIRELIGGLLLLSIMWFMWYFGVRELQAYTHVIVALFAGYAYWRYIRSEKQESDAYILAALATATVPLILQALYGLSGGLYGWWLLIEQVLIMIIGVSIGSKLMIRWGLYVSVAAVLYQLRDLGWAALSVLALFVIGVAVYKISKSDSTQPPKE